MKFLTYSRLIQDMSLLDLVNVAKTWKVTWCVFFGGGGAFCTLFGNITYLSTSIVGSCWSSQWVVLAARHSYSWWRWWLDTLWSTAEELCSNTEVHLQLPKYTWLHVHGSFKIILVVVEGLWTRHEHHLFKLVVVEGSWTGIWTSSL